MKPESNLGKNYELLTHFLTLQEQIVFKPNSCLLYTSTHHFGIKSTVRFQFRTFVLRASIF